MQNRTTPVPGPEYSAAIVEEAVHRIQAAISDHAVDIDALRQALETEMAKGPIPLVALMKVGRRRALDRISRQVRNEARPRRITTM